MNIASAQTTDSLGAALTMERIDSGRVDLLIKLAWAYADAYQTDQADSCARVAMTLATRIGYDFGLGNANLVLGNSFFEVYAYEEAQTHYIRAIQLFDGVLSAQRERIHARIYLANLYIELGMYEDALKFYNQAEALCLEYNRLTNLATIYSNKAVILDDAKEYEQAKATYLDALAVVDTQSDPYTYLDILVNLGSAYYNCDVPDSSIYYSIKAKKKSIVFGDSIALGMTFQNLGLVYEEQGAHNKAFTYYYRGLHLSRNLQNPDSRLSFLESLLFMHIKQQNTDSALYYLNRYGTLADTLRSLRIDEKLYEQAVAFDLAQKETELALSQAAQEKEALKNKSNQIVIAMLIGLIIIALFIGTLLYRINREKTKSIQLLVAHKNNEIEKLIREQEIKTYSAMLEGQEQERKRVAADLHDKVGGLLAATKLQLDANKDLGAADITRLKAMLDESIGTVRSISHKLAAGIIDEVGFVQSVTDLTHLLKNSGRIEVDLFLDRYPSQLDILKEKELYRIVLELISNTLKHANASRITLQVYASRNKVFFSFEDNGAGFDLQQIKKGLGLNSIERRARELAGTLQIDSNPKHGTTVIIEFNLS